MGRGHQFKDCSSEAVLHAAGPRSDFCNSGNARLVFHVCGTTEEVFTSIYFLHNHTGWFFYCSALKKGVKLHVNTFKKVLSVKIALGSGTYSFLGRNSKKNHPVSLLQFTFSKIVSLSVTHVASRFFKRTSSACWEQPPESFKHGPRRA